MNLEPGLKKEVDTVLDALKAGEKGIYLKLRKYPKLYIRDGAKHLFKYDIHSHRLIYTMFGTEKSKEYVILDFLTHQEYNVIFNYH